MAAEEAKLALDCGVEVTESSTNKQHTLSQVAAEEAQLALDWADKKSRDMARIEEDLHHMYDDVTLCMMM